MTTPPTLLFNFSAEQDLLSRTLATSVRLCFCRHHEVSYRVASPILIVEHLPKFSRVLLSSQMTTCPGNSRVFPFWAVPTRFPVLVLGLSFVHPAPGHISTACPFSSPEFCPAVAGSLGKLSLALAQTSWSSLIFQLLLE